MIAASVLKQKDAASFDIGICSVLESVEIEETYSYKNYSGSCEENGNEN